MEDKIYLMAVGGIAVFALIVSFLGVDTAAEAFTGFWGTNDGTTYIADPGDSVAIGLVNASTKLDVNGTIKGTGYYLGSQNLDDRYIDKNNCPPAVPGSNTVPVIQEILGFTSCVYVPTVDYSGWVQNGANVYTKDSGDKVGIGDDTPQNLLDVGGVDAAGSGNLAVEALNDRCIRLEEDGAGTESWEIGVDNDGDLNFYNSGGAAQISFNDDNNVNINAGVIINSLNTGSNAGTDLCVDANDKLCKCGQCA